MAKAQKATNTKAQTAAPVVETKGKRVKAVVTPEMQKMVDAFGESETTSSKIRSLHAAGYNRSQIAEALKVRYQHVRNVLITPLKKQA